MSTCRESITACTRLHLHSLYQTQFGAVHDYLEERYPWTIVPVVQAVKSKTDGKDTAAVLARLQNFLRCVGFFSLALSACTHSLTVYFCSRRMWFCEAR